jgi:hypothetical protein
MSHEVVLIICRIEKKSTNDRKKSIYNCGRWCVEKELMITNKFNFHSS